MSTLQPPPNRPAPAGRRSPTEWIEYEQYIDSQVRRTRQKVKLVELTSAAVVVGVGVIGLLLAAALLEHWILPGGLGIVGRVALFGLLMGGLGFYLVRTVWPLIVNPINPNYAAATIEQGFPALKNSLINLLLFRADREKMPPAVFEALEEQAAQRLSQAPVDQSVDRGPLIRWGYILLAVIVAAVLYTMVSPKSTLATAGRVLMPWSDIATPSRVRITNIAPGSVEIIQGDSLEITATVRGLRPEEGVHLSFDTADQQLVEQLVAMRPLDETGKFGVKLPVEDSSAGIQQDLRYRIVAGDGRSVDFEVRALTAPSIRVSKVRYDFPAYTGAGDRTVTGRGDILAIDGTKVTIYAEANSEIESAHVDLAADGTNDLRMRADGAAAQVTFDLALPRGQTTPRQSSYLLQMTNAEGVTNRNPPQHRLEILADTPPEIEISEPEEPSREVQLNETVTMRVRAWDNDYALSQVVLHFVKLNDQEVANIELLASTAPQQERLEGRYEFTAMEHDLQPGDVVEYWAEAVDNRQPRANRTLTERKELVIVAPPDDQKQGNPQQQPENNSPQADQDQQEGEANQSQRDQNRQGQPGDRGQQGDPQQQPNQAAGDDTPQQGEQPGQGEQAGAEGEQQPGEQQPGEQQQGEQQTEEGQQPGQDQPGMSQDSPGGESGEQGEQGIGGAQQQQSGDGERNGAQDQPGGDGGDQQPPGAGGQEGNQGEGQRENDRAIANDGSDDARAWEQMQEHLSEKQRQEGTRQPGESSGDPSTAQAESGDPAGGDRRDQQGFPDEKPAGQGEDQQPRQGENPGAKTPDGQSPEKGKEPSDSQNPEASKSGGAEQQGRKGEAGAGEEASPQGAPEPQEDSDPRKKQADAGKPDEKTDKEEPAMPGRGKDESDSRGESGGENPGGGEEGGGQKANREGTGSAGQNQAADEGGGQSRDQGPGDAGKEAGDAQEAGRETGQAGNEQGTGSQTRETPAQDSEAGQEPGKPGEGQRGDGRPGDEPPGDGQPAEGESGEEAGGTQPRGGDQPSERGDQGAGEREPSGERPPQNGADQQSPSPPSREGEPGESGDQTPQQGEQPPGERPAGDASTAPQGEAGSSDSQAPARDYQLQEADKANLEYAKKQTNMVLESLEEQLNKKQVDQELLDKLGWSEQDLKRFVDRWQQLRQAAAADTPEGKAAQQKLDERLRKLGPKRQTISGETVREQDEVRDLGDTYRGEIPRRFRERVQRYTEGISGSSDRESR